ncbi:MAG: hypothetical protein HYX27_09305 [Acidobacteria bacterium]|nr:hypothetical protein [Acidobacteriota bacterium]
MLALPVFGQLPGGFGSGMSSYDGPTILGRGGPGTGNQGSDHVPIHIQASLNANYDTSLLGYSLDSTGNFVTKSSYGFDANLNASGRKAWRRSFLGLDYGGNYSHYSSQSFFNGSNHQLNLAYGTQFGSKVQIISQLGAGTSNRFLGGPSVFQANEFEFITPPTSELFDSRSYFIGDTTSMIYSFSRRQSVRFSGSGAAVRRRARGLVDMETYGASGDWVYRASRRTSMGVSYSFNHYDFTKIFGDTDVHTIGFHISRKFGRSWEGTASLTGSRQSTVGVRSFALDPVLAAILGRTTGSEVFESNNLLYGYSAGIMYRFRRSSAFASVARAINPGNGYFLTSISQNASVGFNYNPTRRWTLNASAGYNRLLSLGFTSGAYSGWTGGGGTTFKLSDSFGVNFRYDWRTYQLFQTALHRDGHRISTGITWFPKNAIASLH